MKHSIPHWQLGGFLFTSVLGTFLHFLFDLTGGSVLAALFSAVNESIWEHMKLLFYPMILFALVEYFVWGKQRQDFWCRKAEGIFPALFLIPVVYYTYTGILGISADWFNITIFFLAAGFAFRRETLSFLGENPCLLTPAASVFLLLLMAAGFTLLTFHPVKIPFFRDPLTGTYGFFQTI